MSGAKDQAQLAVGCQELPTQHLKVMDHTLLNNYSFCGLDIRS